MTMLIGFVLPLVAWLLLFRPPSFASRDACARPGWRLVVGIIAVTLVIALATVWTGAISPDTHWSSGTQIAWTGVSAKDGGSPVAIGGSQDEAEIGWPNRNWIPRVEAAPPQGGRVWLRISGGRGFLRDSQLGFLNGFLAPPGTRVALGAFAVQVERRTLLFRRIPLAVFDESGQLVASIELPRPGRDRVHDLGSRLALEVGRLRAEGGPTGGATALALEDWARDIVVLTAENGEVRFSPPGEVADAMVEIPRVLTMLWPRFKQSLQLERTAGGSIALRFPSPWRVSTPLPPKRANQDVYRELVVTRHARPGDLAFVLPIGRATEDPRSNLTIQMRPDAPAYFKPPARLLPEAESGITSRITVPLRTVELELVTAADAPRSGLHLALVLLALTCCVGGFLVLAPSMQSRDFWLVGGLVGSLWGFLCIRTLLAIRYALAPNHLDSLAVGGVVKAYLALLVVPAIVLLCARLQRDRYYSSETIGRNGVAALAYALAIPVFGLLQLWLADRLWPSLPGEVKPGLALVFGVLVISAALIFWAFIQYVAAARDPLYEDTPLLAPFRVLDFFRNGTATRVFWTAAGTLAGPQGPLLAVTVLLVAILTVLFILSRTLETQKLFQELLFPTLLCWLPGGLWLASTVSNPDTRRPRLSVRAMLTLGPLLAFVPAFLIPFTENDVGGVMATMASFIPIVALLLGARAYRTGFTVAAAVGIPILILSLGAGYLRFAIGHLPGFVERRSAIARVLAHEDQNAVQEHLPLASVSPSSSGSGLPYQGLSDAIQHLWSNKAMAFEGGVLGLGYGKAPTRRSEVRQDTIQFDSVFSFFILSEHGLVGGVSLIAMYLIPLFFLLRSARIRLDLGHALGLAIVSMLFLEGAFHAAMNLGILPFSGRNLPLLSVNSLSDLARWMVLFAFLVQVVLWRSDGLKSGLRPEASSIVAKSPVHYSAMERWGAFLPVVILLCIAPALLGWWIVRADLRILQKADFKEEFDWTIMLDKVQWMINQDAVKIDPSTLMLSFDPKLLGSTTFKATGWSMIEQEIARFNALTRDERLESTPSLEFFDLTGQMARLWSIGDYDRLLEKYMKDDGRRFVRRQSLFEIKERVKTEDDSEKYDLKANRAYIGRLSFHAPPRVEDAPTIVLGDLKTQIVGPAWVSGDWISTISIDPMYPWSGILASAATREWKQRGPAEASAIFGKLTLDPVLHAAAQGYATRKGRELYDSLLKRGCDGCRPTRVAIAVVSLPGGETLALGGWPRMSSDVIWNRQGEDWIPPLAWVERRAPTSIRSRYQGDRNFDRAVLGSASKPLWAAAALAVHPGLDRRLLTKGVEEQESAVFGLTIPGRPWKVHPTPWVDWNHYLAQSDNRFHVRVGFLGLAEKPGGDVVAGLRSESDHESLDGGPNPWGQAPMFDQRIVEISVDGVSQPRIARVRHLDETPLASHLERMFRVALNEGDLAGRYSFWTRSDVDDESTTAEERTAWSAIAPDAPDLALDKISTPRDYVNLLLGGYTNMWSNVDFAGAFATVVTGNPVVSHVTAGPVVLRASPERERFPQIALRLRPGLAAVLTSGTAAEPLGAEARAFLASLPDVKAYAKTGTLRASDGEEATSRIALALIRWDSERRGTVKAGIVVSIVAERAAQGTASRWLGEWLLENRAEIVRVLGG